MGTSVYGHYSQEELDAQYNLRGRHPDHPSHFERWSRASDDARRNLRCVLDLPYGEAGKQTLDIYQPAAGAGPHPLLAFIHGGYWQAMDKADFGFLALPFAEAGIATAMINYSLAPAATIHEIVEENRAAHVWIWRNAARLGLDASRLFVCGHSAGGHLAAMMLTTDWPAVQAWLPPDLIKGAGAISGLYDLEPIRLCFLNQALRMDAADARAASPIHLRPAAVPLVLAVGEGETEEFHRQQEALLRAWSDAGALIRTVAMPDRDHFTIVDALADATSPLFQALSRLVLQTSDASGHDT